MLRMETKTGAEVGRKVSRDLSKFKREFQAEINKKELPLLQLEKEYYLKIKSYLHDLAENIVVYNHPEV